MNVRALLISLVLALLPVAAWAQSCTYTPPNQTDSCGHLVVQAVPTNADPTGAQYVDTQSVNPAYSCVAAWSPPTTASASDIFVIANPAGSGKVVRIAVFGYLFKSTTASSITVAINKYSGAPSGGTPTTITPGAANSTSPTPSTTCATYAATGQTDGTLESPIYPIIGFTMALTAAEGSPNVFPNGASPPPIVLNPGEYVGYLLTASSVSGLTGVIVPQFTEGTH
jgi:hypothetical protein